MLNVDCVDVVPWLKCCLQVIGYVGVGWTFELEKVWCTDGTGTSGWVSVE